MTRRKSRKKRSAGTVSGRNDKTRSGLETSAPSTSVHEWRYEWLVLALILVAGFGLRAAYLRELVHEPDFAAPALDPQFHDYWARAIVSGDWTPPLGMPDPAILSAPYSRPPAYPFFLAAVYWLSSSSYLAARIVQMGIGLLNCVLAWRLARWMFGRAVGLATAAFMAVYWVFVYFEGELNSPVLEVFAVLALMHVLRLWAKDQVRMYALLAGLGLGVLVLLRPNALAFAPVLLVWMAWRAKRIGRWLAAACLTCAGLAVVVAPVTIRNYAVSGEFFIVTCVGAVNLYIGNNEHTDCVMPTIPEMMELTGARTWSCFNYPAIVEGIAKKTRTDAITYRRASRYFQRRASRYIRQHPGQTLDRVLKRALLFWGPAEVTNNKVTHYAKARSAVLRHLPGFPLVLAMCLTGLMMLLAEVCPWRRRDVADHERRRNEMVVLILLFVLVYFGTFLPLLVSCRFRVLLTPFLLMFGAYGAWRLYGLFASRAFGKAAVGCGVAGALFGVCGIQFVPYEPELDYWHFMRGVAYETKGDSHNAALEFEKAVETAAAFTAVMPHLFLADIRARHGMPVEAVEHYLAALAIDPEFAATRSGILDMALDAYVEAMGANPKMPDLPDGAGERLEKLGMLESAAKYYAARLLKDPDNAQLAQRLARFRHAAPEDDGRESNAASIHIGQGNVLVGQGEIEKGVEQYMAALARDPGNLDAHFNLGAVKAAQGKLDEALVHYYNALDCAPGDAAVACHIGLTLSRQGEINEAISYFNLALGNDPSHVMALNGLANVLALRGEYDNALEQQARVLEIAPGDKTVHYNMARTLALKGELDNALRSYEEALKRYPDTARVHLNMGVLLVQRGYPAKAIAHFEAALKIDPSNQTVREHLERARALTSPR